MKLIMWRWKIGLLILELFFLDLEFLLLFWCCWLSVWLFYWRVVEDVLGICFLLCLSFGL